jgi:hypothetical protein
MLDKAITKDNGFNDWQKRLSILAKDAGFHEAGHFLSAKKCGFSPARIKITIYVHRRRFVGELKDGFAGSVTSSFILQATDDCLVKSLKDRIINLYSGSLAQAIIPKYPTPEFSMDNAKEYLNSNGKDDNAKANKYISLLKLSNKELSIIKKEINSIETDLVTIYKSTYEIDEDLLNKARVLLSSQANQILKIGNTISQKAANLKDLHVLYDKEQVEINLDKSDIENILAN